MSVGGATVEAAGGAVKKGLKWWVVGFGLTALAAGALAIGLLAAFTPLGLGLIIGLGALAAVGGGVAAATLGSGIGAAVAGTGAAVGAAKGASDHVKRQGQDLVDQKAALTTQNAQLMQHMQQDAILNPGAPQDGRFTAKVTSERQAAAQRPNIPPLQ